MSLQPSGRLAWPALSVAKAMPPPAMPLRDGMGTPHATGARLLHGDINPHCFRWGWARTPRSRPAALGGIGTGVIPQPASLPCHSTAGREETATNPWRAGFLLAFIFTDA